MPSGTYRVTEREKNQSHQHDQSYKNCVITMLIFILLCIVIIAATWPWKGAHPDRNVVDAYEASSSRRNGKEKTISSTTTDQSDQKSGKYQAMIPSNIDTSSTPYPVLDNNSEFSEIYSMTEKNFNVETIRPIAMNNNTRNTEDDFTEKITSSSFAETTTSTPMSVFKRVDYLETTTMEYSSVAIKETNFDGDSQSGSTSIEIPSTTMDTLDVNEKIITNESTATENPSDFGWSGEFGNKTATEEAIVSNEQENELLESTTSDIQWQDASILSDSFAREENKTEYFTTEPEEINIDSNYYSETGSASSEMPTTIANILDENKRITSSEDRDFTSLKRLLVAKYFGNDSATTEDASNSDWLDEFDDKTTTEQAISWNDKENEVFQSTTSQIERQDASTLLILDVDSFNQDKNETENFTTDPKETNMDNNYSSKSDSASAEIHTTTVYPLNENKRITTPKDEDSTSLKRLVVAKYFGNDSTTTEDPSNSAWLHELNDKIRTEESITLNEEEHERSETERTISAIERAHTPTISDDSIRKKNKPENLKRAIHSENTCMSGRCKQQTSKMLAWMNHTADPCEDFYEYACGGLEADPEMIILDKEAEVVSIIKDQMMNEKNEGKSLKFYEYYESCKSHGKHPQNAEKLLDEALKTINESYTPENWPNESPGITELILNLLHHGRPVLFDITPEINEKDSSKFILKIGPPLPSSLSSIFGQDTCNPGPSKQKLIDLDAVYETYVSCRNNRSNVLKFINNTLHNSPYIKDYIDFDLIKELLSIYPPESEIREAYRSKHYTTVTLSKLESQSTLLHWTQLIYNLTGQHMSPDTELQLYFEDNLIRALQKIDLVGKEHFSELNNAILGLYIGNLYNEIFKSDFSKDLESNCLKIATKLLPDEASRLYISSFTATHLTSIKSQISGIFDELKKTLKMKFKQIKWTKKVGRQYLIDKLNAIQISMPQLSYSNDNYHDIIFNDNFFFNTMQLMKKSREKMYTIFNENPNTPKILWTHLAKAHEPQPQALFALNLILIPFGAVQVSKLTGHEEKYDYSTLASIGNLLAHEITSYFDTNGIQYWNATKHTPYSLPYNNGYARINYEAYIECHDKVKFSNPIEITVPESDQHITFTIPQGTLNERLSDAAGVKLAYETLVRLGVNSVKLPPWIDLNIYQLFYLAYAQTSCTKAPLIASIVSLYEDPHLPSRLRIAIATNNREIGQVFQCPEGSQVLPNFSCDIFPDLEIQEIDVTSA